MVGYYLFPCSTSRAYDDVVNVCVCVLQILENLFHHTLKHGIAILYTHYQDLPLVRTLGCRHAGYVAMFGLEGHLMIAFLKVEHAPDFAVLFLENVLDTRRG